MFEPKWPGVCALIVVAFAFSAHQLGHKWIDLFLILCAAIDCFRYVKR